MKDGLLHVPSWCGAGTTNLVSRPVAVLGPSRLWKRFPVKRAKPAHTEAPLPKGVPDALAYCWPRKHPMDATMRMKSIENEAEVYLHTVLLIP